VRESPFDRRITALAMPMPMPARSAIALVVSAPGPSVDPSGGR
jgi:hypothetical protein